MESEGEERREEEELGDEEELVEEESEDGLGWSRRRRMGLSGGERGGG